MTPLEGRQARHARTVGVLLGVHVGDALGATTEFASRESARTAFASTVDDVDVVGGGVFGWAPGDPTDDTDLTLAVHRAYRDVGLDAHIDRLSHAAAEHMAAWFRTDPRDVGGATSRALTRFLSTHDASCSGETDERSQGNGSLMRTVAVALANLEDPIRRADHARAISAITHAHPVCLDACVAYCDLVAAMITSDVATAADAASAARDMAHAAIGRSDLHTDVTDALERALSHDGDVGKVATVNGAAEGWVLTSLEVAVTAVTAARPAAEMLVEVVRLGGDADTNGAITGGLLGARDGSDAWPGRWIDRLACADELMYGAALYA